MSADGNIEIAVTAEGVDDAAAELSEGEGDGGGGMGGGGGGDSFRDSLRGGLIGGIVASAAGPLLDVLDPILKILQAFLAPLSVMLLRLFQPVLRILVARILPAWLDFMNGVNRWIASLSGIERMVILLGALVGGIAGASLGGVVGAIAGALIGAIVGGIVAEVSNGMSLSGLEVSLTRWLEDIYNGVAALPGDIAASIELPSLPGGGGNGASVIDKLPPSQVASFVSDRSGLSDQQIALEFNSDIEGTIEAIQESNNIDLGGR